jgi:cytochrome c oxidase assembly protein subunit 15
MAVADILIDRPATASAARVGVTAGVRGYFLLLFALCLAAFVLGIDNRFTVDGIFNVPPNVDWLPPWSAQQWYQSFAQHQQDPVFAACGGTESLGEFKVRYWWEWLRRASLVGVGAVAFVGLCGGLLRRHRALIADLSVLVAAGLCALALRLLTEFAVGHFAALASFDVGQYRHAAELVGASIVAAMVLAFAIAPMAARARTNQQRRSERLWLVFIVVNIGFGALFAARNAAAVWTTWPGYQGGALPPLDQLLAYHPLFLNFTFNQYTIQLVHRVLSVGLLLAALIAVVLAPTGAGSLASAWVRLALIVLQMATGIATLLLGVPAMLSIVHALGSIALLAWSLAMLLPAPMAASDARYAS